MQVIVSGGGTAGHIYPALALAEVLQSRGHYVRFAGTPNGLEARLAREAGLDFEPFEAAGFNRNHPTTIFSSSAKILKSTARAKRWFEEIEPDVVVGFGGYVSLPVCRAAKSKGIPYVIHEQNSVMGLANKQLAKHASAVALTYARAGEGLREGSPVTVTGNPVRRSVLDASREEGRRMLGIDEGALVLLAFGGSLGARHINTALCGMKDDLLGIDGLTVVQVTGPKEYEAVAGELALTTEEERRWKLFGYQDRMGDTLAASDFTVARAGATSLAEISALNVPALLVPYPFATEDHQTMNAQAYVEQGAALMVADEKVETPEFSDKLISLATDATLRARMREAAAALKTGDAALRLADVVISAVNRPQDGTISGVMKKEG